MTHSAIRKLAATALLIGTFSAARSVTVEAQVHPSSAMIRADALIGDASHSPRIAFNAVTVDGFSLDGLKIAQGSRPGNYIGVFDSVGPANSFIVRVATSNNFVAWTTKAILSKHGSVPTVYRLRSGAYIVAFELATANGDSSIEVQYFDSYGALVNGSPARSIVLPHHLSPYNEGTPTIESATVRKSVSSSTIKISFHYNVGNTVDRQGVGVLTNFTTWTERRNTALDQAVEREGAKGSIGARDTVNLDGTPIEIVEGELKTHTWNSWRLFIYSPVTKTASPLTVSTPRGSDLSIGLGRASVVRGRTGRRILVMTAFVYSQGSPPGTAGELVWWRPI